MAAGIYCGEGKVKEAADLGRRANTRSGKNIYDSTLGMVANALIAGMVVRTPPYGDWVIKVVV
jgi:hypothetical protein